MKAQTLISFVIIGYLIAGKEYVHAAEPQPAVSALQLSPELLKLLRAEMQGISGGVQKIALSIATADWQAIEESSAKIHTSYLLEQKLTLAQVAELQKILPERFKQLDAQFHQRAKKLGSAAAAHDSEQVVFHYSRLLESCTECHSEFAKARFPNFFPILQPPHHH